MTLWVPRSAPQIVTGEYLTTRYTGTYGASVTEGTTDYGSWVNVIPALASDACGIEIHVTDNAAAGANTVLRLGVDYAGGSSYTAIMSGVLVGGALLNQPRTLYLPLRIPAGASVAVAAYGALGSTMGVQVRYGRAPVGPARFGAGVESVGVSGYSGTAVTYGTASDGAWTSLGTTTYDTWYWGLSAQIDASDTSHTGTTHTIDLAFGDASNKTVILYDWAFNTNTSETSYVAPFLGAERYVPAGTTIYARAQSSNTTNDPLRVSAHGVRG